MNHTQIGDITEQRFILYCMERNIPISKPLNNNLPYDSIIEVNGELLKVQVKTGYENGIEHGFMFNTRSTSKNYTEITTKNYIVTVEFPRTGHRVHHTHTSIVIFLSFYRRGLGNTAVEWGMYESKKNKKETQKTN